MYETIFSLTGLGLDNFNFDHNVIFVVTSLFLLYCLGYMFNFFQTLMERTTAKKGK